MAQNQFAFTEARIAKLPAPASGRKEYHDEKTNGLVLRVTHNGAKTFSWFRKVNGRPVRLTIGQHPTVTVDQARKRAAELSGDVARGRDPHAERQARHTEATLKELFDHWLEIHAKARKRSWPDDARMFNKYMKDWHHRKLSAITGPVVLAWHRKIGKGHGPIQANRCKALLATMFGKAAEVGYMGPNPCAVVENFPEHSRERFLLPDEMTAFFTALAAEDEVWRDFFLLALFTGE